LALATCVVSLEFVFGSSSIYIKMRAFSRSRKKLTKIYYLMTVYLCMKAIHTILFFESSNFPCHPLMFFNYKSIEHIHHLFFHPCIQLSTSITFRLYLESLFFHINTTLFECPAKQYFSFYPSILQKDSCFEDTTVFKTAIFARAKHHKIRKTVVFYKP
jgi:hypothetical protein